MRNSFFFPSNGNVYFIVEATVLYNYREGSNIYSPDIPTLPKI
jgi:hypothetical protein